jgi:hypothetical protein
MSISMTDIDMTQLYRYQILDRYNSHNRDIVCTLLLQEWMEGVARYVDTSRKDTK